VGEQAGEVGEQVGVGKQVEEQVEESGIAALPATLSVAAPPSSAMSSVAAPPSPATPSAAVSLLSVTPSAAVPASSILTAMLLVAAGSPFAIRHPISPKAGMPGGRVSPVGGNGRVGGGGGLGGTLGGCVGVQCTVDTHAKRMAKKWVTDITHYGS
jgi:hypothetical protein